MIGVPLGDQDVPSKPAASDNVLLAAVERGLDVCNSIIVVFAAIALIAACIILSHSVLSRALLHSANYSQDEAAVFLLVGATFMTAAYVQGQRGHIGSKLPSACCLPSPIASDFGWSMSRACCSVDSSPGNPGRSRMRPGSMARSRTRCGRRRWRFPTGLWQRA